MPYVMHGWDHLRSEDRDLILKGLVEGRALGGPFHAEIDPIDVCNADCFFCCSQDLRAGDVLPWERLSVLTDELIAHGLRSVRLAGGGEPLIYPALGQLCEKLAEASVVIDNLNTNGIRMNEKTLEHLLQTRVVHWYVSLNYTSPEQYARFMGVPANRFEWITTNIRLADERLRALGRRTESLLHTQFMVHRSTIDDLPRMAELALDLPVDTVVIRALGALQPEESLRPEDEQRLREMLPEIARTIGAHKWLILDLEIYGRSLQAFCEDLMREARASRTAPYTDGLCYPDPQSVEIQGVEFCYIGWHSMTIQGNGDAHACCMLMHESAVPAYGNVMRQGIQEVWHGPMYQRHRQEMRTAMLMEELTPGQRRSFLCTTEGCWKRDACPLSNQMADASFYREAHQHLDALRRRPMMRMARWGNGLARRAGLVGRA